MFTIIVAVFNGERLLARLLSSIISQPYKQLQLVVIDGGSTDGTLKIIREHEHHIDYWVSEADKGIYDAWNKGLAVAKGTWIMFLGCDDILTPTALGDYADFLQEQPDHIEYISAKVQMVDTNYNPIRVKGWPWQWPLFLQEMTVAHPGSLHSRKLFQKYGNYNTQFKIVGDYELLLRARENLSAAFFNKVTAVMMEGGASDSRAAIKEHYYAATLTGGYPKLGAIINAAAVITKFAIKKVARRWGFNIYIRK